MISATTQALIAQAYSDHDAALALGTAEQQSAAAAVLAQQADDTAKAVALTGAQTAGVSLRAALAALTADLTLGAVPPLP